MDRISYKLADPQRAYKVLRDVWSIIKPALLSGQVLALDVRAETRSTAQNAMLWSILGDVSRQVDWHGQRLDSEAWKDMATAALKQQRVVPGITGGFVVLGQRTSKMTRREMSDLIEFLYAFGAERGVVWSRTSLGRDVPDEVSHD